MTMSDRDIFTTDEVVRMRTALDSFRRGPGYEPGKWKVSDANRRADVVGERPASVRIRDLTLRVIEQMSDVSLSHAQRLRLLEALATAGASSLETSSFGRGHTVEEMRDEVKTVKAVNPDCELVYTGAGTEKHMKMAAEAGYDVVRVLSGVFLGDALPAYAGAVYHRAWQGREWKDLRFPKGPAEVTERAQQLIELGRSYGLKVGGSVLIVSYANDEDVAQYCRGIAEAGAYDVQIGDHASGTSPEAFAHFVRIAREADGDLEIAAHTHDMFGLASATAVAAGLAGATILETSVNGFAEGPAQGDLAHISGAMEMLYGVRTGIDLSQLTALSRLTEELIGHRRPGDWGLTGPNIFDYGNDGDEYALEIKVDPLIHMGVAPEAVGNRRNLRIGRTSGPWTMWEKLDELGLEARREQVAPILAACKREMAQLGRGLTDAEIQAIATRLLDPARVGSAS
jgi:isopropylmalate/homocitrate/citramalate synthase